MFAEELGRPRLALHDVVVAAFERDADMRGGQSDLVAIPRRGSLREELASQPSADLQHDLADMFARFHAGMRVGGLLQRKDLVDDRLQSIAFDIGPHGLGDFVRTIVLNSTDRGPEASNRSSVSRRRMMSGIGTSACRSALESDRDVPAVVGEACEIASAHSRHRPCRARPRHRRRRSSAGPRRRSRWSVIDRMRRAHFDCGDAFLVASRRSRSPSARTDCRA